MHQETDKASSLFVSARLLLSTRLVCWNALAGEFTLQTRPGTNSAHLTFVCCLWLIERRLEGLWLPAFVGLIPEGGEFGREQRRPVSARKAAVALW